MKHHATSIFKFISSNNSNFKNIFGRICKRRNAPLTIGENFEINQLLFN